MNLFKNIYYIHNFLFCFVLCHGVTGNCLSIEVTLNFKPYEGVPRKCEPCEFSKFSSWPFDGVSLKSPTQTSRTLVLSTTIPQLRT